MSTPPKDQSAKQGLMPDTSPAVETQNGIPVWTHGPAAVAITSEMVRNLDDDD